jgi:hypothetical protein
MIRTESVTVSDPRHNRKTYVLRSIFKTEFILQYLSEPELRRRIRRGLLNAI